METKRTASAGTSTDTTGSESRPVDPRLAAIDNALYRISAKAIILKDNKVLLVREKDDDWWSFPGGGIDYGETVCEALVREVSEELGVAPARVQAEKTVLCVTIGGVVAGVPRASLFYRVTVPAGEIKPTEDVLEQKWFTLEEIAGLYISPGTGDMINELRRVLT